MRLPTLSVELLHSTGTASLRSISGDGVPDRFRARCHHPRTFQEQRYVDAVFHARGVLARRAYRAGRKRPEIPDAIRRPRQAASGGRNPISRSTRRGACRCCASTTARPLTENTAILPYLGKRFGLWPSEPLAEARALSLVGFFAASVHPAHAHIGRPERYAADPAAFPTIKDVGRKSFHGHLQQIDDMLTRTRLVFRPVLGPRCLRFCLLRLGLPPRAADAGAQELYGIQGSDAAAPRGPTRGRGREAGGGSVQVRVSPCLRRTTVAVIGDRERSCSRQSALDRDQLVDDQRIRCRSNARGRGGPGIRPDRSVYRTDRGRNPTKP